MKEITKLAHSIALADAAATLESHSLRAEKDGEKWLDIDSEIFGETLSTFLADELRYLELRGALVRHPEIPTLVRVVEVWA